MIEGMIFSALGGLLSSALSGVVGNRTDAAVYSAWRVIGKRLREGGRPINHDLQRAVIRSYISALITICNECLAELRENKKRHEKEIRWFEDKITVSENKIKELEKSTEYVVPPLESFSEIELLLTPEGALARERIETIKGKLIQASIDSDGIPPCFKGKIEKPNAGLFELMSLFFAREIKQNEVVRNIFEGQLLAKMDIELQGHRLTIDLLEVSLLGVAKEVSEVLSITTRTEAKVDSIAADVKKILEPTKGIKRPEIPDDVRALLEESANLLNVGKYENARSVTQKALELAISHADNIAIARAKNLLSIILHENDNKHDDAIKLLKEALTIFRDAKSEEDIANTLGLIGNTEIDGENFDAGKAFLVEALEIYKKLGDKIGIAQKLVKLGWIDHRRGRDKESLDYYDQALVDFLSAYNERSSEDKLNVNIIQGIAGCYQCKGLVYEATGKIADAEANYAQALEWMRKTGFQQDIAKILALLAKLKYCEAQYDSGNQYLDEAIQIYEYIKDYSWISRCQQMKGQVFFTTRKPDKAIAAFEAALLSAEKSGDCKQQEDILSTLGNFYLETKKNDKAREYFVKARDVSLKEGLLDGYAASLEHLAHIANLDKNSNERDRLLNEGVQTLSRQNDNVLIHQNRNVLNWKC
ncbi:MAG: hypothetical protein HY807_07985 [Nitrospirae bacterium]|nr:hypothetical protein [Nitrospirota bacterium]